MKKLLILLGIVAVIAIAFLNPFIAMAAAAGGGAVLWKRK